MYIGRKFVKDIKHETGFPGNPKKNLFFPNLPNVVGFPGLIATLSNNIFNPNSFSDSLTISYFPRDIPPLVINKSKFFDDLNIFLNSVWLSFEKWILTISPPNNSTKCFIKILLVETTRLCFFFFVN